MLIKDKDIIYFQESQLPLKTSALASQNNFFASTDDFPASCSQFGNPKEPFSSEFVYYDGSRRSFSPPNSKSAKKRKNSEDPATDSIPRPTNSFLCARSMLQQNLKAIGSSTVQCSNIMGTFWKLKTSSFIKHYFRYIAFVEGARHSARYPHYKYKPKRRKSKAVQNFDMVAAINNDWNAFSTTDFPEVTANTNQQTEPTDNAPEANCDFGIEPLSTFHTIPQECQVTQSLFSETMDFSKFITGDVLNEDYMVPIQINSSQQNISYGLPQLSPSQSNIPQLSLPQVKIPSNSPPFLYQNSGTQDLGVPFSRSPDFELAQTNPTEQIFQEGTAPQVGSTVHALTQIEFSDSESPEAISPKSTVTRSTSPLSPSDDMNGNAHLLVSEILYETFAFKPRISKKSKKVAKVCSDSLAHRSRNEDPLSILG